MASEWFWLQVIETSINELHKQSTYDTKSSWVIPWFSDIIQGQVLSSFCSATFAFQALSFSFLCPRDHIVKISSYASSVFQNVSLQNLLSRTERMPLPKPVNTVPTVIHSNQWRLCTESTGTVKTRYLDKIRVLFPRKNRSISTKYT